MGKIGAARRLIVRLPTLWLAVFLAADAQMSAAQSPTRDFYARFGGGERIHPSLKLFGPDAGEVASTQEDGLRITLPADRSDARPVGISPAFSLSGDFEVTAGYQILSADEGAGLSMRLTNYPVEFSRYKQQGESVYVISQYVSIDGKRPDDVTFPAQSNQGALRVVRSGTTLHFLVADAAQPAFREIHSVPYLDGDCTVRLVATARKGAAVDVRILDFRVRSGALPISPWSNRMASAWRGARLMAGVIGLVVALMSLVWLWVRRRSRAQ